MSEVYVLQRFDRKKGRWRFLMAVSTEHEAKEFLRRPHKDRPQNYRCQRFVPLEEFVKST